MPTARSGTRRTSGSARALIEKYKKDFPFGDKDLQASCAAGELPPQNCPGNRRWIQIMYDSFLLMPTNRRCCRRETRNWPPT